MEKVQLIKIITKHKVVYESPVKDRNKTHKIIPAYKPKKDKAIFDKYRYMYSTLLLIRTCVSPDSAVLRTLDPALR